MSIICFHYITNGRLFVPEAKLYLPIGYSAFISREIQQSRAQIPAPCLELAKVINFALSIRKFAQDAAVFVIELFESALVYCGSDFTYHFIIEIEVITSVAISQGIIIDHTALILDGKSFLKNSGEF